MKNLCSTNPCQPLFVKLSFIAFLSLFSLTISHAQDSMLLQNGDEIASKVLEITPGEIKYKLWANLQGPTITIPRSDVWMIKYENGTKDLMSKKQTAVPAETPEKKPAEAIKAAQPVQNQTSAPQTTSADNVKPNLFTTTLFAAISIPTGDFGDPTLGGAKKGFSLGVEESRRLGSSNFSLLGHFSFDHHRFGGEALIDDEYYTVSGKYTLLWSMSGIKLQSAKKSSGLYGQVMGGFCYGRLDSEDGQTYVNNFPFSVGLGAGYAFKKANIGFRYFSNTSIFSDGYTKFSQPMKNIQLLVGVSF